MKRSFFIIGAIFALFTVAVLPVKAGEDTASYTISEEAGELVLKEGEEVLRRGGLDELISSVPSGGKITLDSLRVGEPLELSGGSYTLLGDAEFLYGITVREGASLTISGMGLDFGGCDGIAINVKGGDVRISSSSISLGASSGIVIDYSERGALVLDGADVQAASHTPAVRVSHGSLAVISGSIKNTLGTAIKSSAALSLSGEPDIEGAGFDIESSRALSLTFSGKSYVARHTLDLKYDLLFDEGEAYEIFNKASEESISRISVFDKNGKQYRLSFFDEPIAGSEGKCAFVYLPYEVKFVDDGGLISTSYRLKGEFITPPDAPAKEGYLFSFWTRSSGEEFDFSSPVNGNISLFSKYKLLPPVFEISSVNKEYNGEWHTLTFDEVSHPLDAKGGFCEFVWYKGDEVISRAGGVNLKAVKDSGEYSCLITYSYESDSASVLVEGISVNIRPKRIPLPSIDGATYDGTKKIPLGLDGALYTFECEGYIDAGVYEIELTLIDKENCVFISSDKPSAKASFEIFRAENSFLSEPSVKNVYEGFELEISCRARFGEVYYVFSDSKDGEYTAVRPTTKGTYYIKACVDESKNYEALRSRAYSFEILSDVCLSLEILTREDAEYTAFDRFLGRGVTLLASYRSGREETVDISALSVKYQRGSYLRWGDSGVILTYRGISITYPLTVSRADYSLEALRLTEYSIVYDGRYHEYLLPDTPIVGRDNIPLRISAVGGGTEAGEYKIKITFYTESTDYNTPSQREVTMTIEPMPIELTWSGASFVYDGKKKLPVCSYTDALGIVRYPKVNGEKTNAGAGYVAYAESDGGNYSFENKSFVFEIKKGSYNLSGVRWQGGEFVYNGKAQAVILTGLPDGISVVGYTDSTKTNAGTYTARATLSYDAENYNKPVIEPYEWTIHKASYSLGNFSIEDTSAIFSGEAHYPKVIGDMPQGLDGISLSYKFSTGVTNVDEGRIAVRVEYYTESPNYTVPDAEVCYVTVMPKEIEVIWGEVEFTYTGEAILPSAECGICEIEVRGAQIGAGEYTATAVSLDGNYTVKNSRCDFKIKKAQNRFIGEITIDDVYTGREISPVANPMWGEVDVLIFSDIGCTEPAQITAGGRYYAICVVPESENYYELRSAAIEFIVIDLTITDISVEILKSGLYAFYTLNADDFVISVTYNDGVVSEYDNALVEVVYQNGDSLRRGDERVVFCFEGREVAVDISVDYATLDLSGVEWGGLIQAYDGEEKYPSVSGLPDGITLLGFSESGAVDAGEYYFTPVFSYDEENYSSPSVEALKMVINKQIVPSPSDFSVEYDGKSHKPVSKNPLYTFECIDDAVNVGEYEALAILADSKNYEFSDGGSLVISVTPRILHVTVSEGRVLPDGGIEDYFYEITSGSVVEGEELSFTPKIEDEAITLTTDNKNYTLVVTKGEIVKVSPTSGDLLVAMITAGVSLVVMLFAALVYAKRRVIFGKYIVRASNISASAEKVVSVEPKPTKTTEIIEISPEAPKDEAVYEEEESRAKDLMERAEKIGRVEVDMEKADSLITDALAKDLIKRAERPIRTGGSERGVINVDTLSEYFYPGERIDINVLKKRRLIPDNVSVLKVLARGRVDKPLSVYANEFTPAAVKMIVLSGGEAVKAQTVKKSED